MINLGNVPASTVLYVPFATYAGSTGASVTCSGLAVTDIEIYKNGSTTQRSSDAGYTLLDTDGIDFDGVTGLHGFSIDLADNTDAGFFAVGSWYWVVVSAITVDSQTVTFLAAVFRIAPAEAISGHPKTDVGGWLGTAPATPTVNGVPEVDVTHLLGTAWLTPGTAGTPDVNAKLISSDATAADTLELFAEALDQTTGQIDAGTFVTGTLASASDVWASATRTLTAGTNIALAKGTGVTGFTDLSAADVRTAVGLASANLDTQLGDLPTNAELATALGTADDATLTAIALIPASTITLLGSGTQVFGHSYLESIKRIEVVAGAATLTGAGTGTEVMTSSDASKTVTFTVDGSGNISAAVWT